MARYGDLTHLLKRFNSRGDHDGNRDDRRNGIVKLGAKATTGWRATISVAMSNYIEAGSIIAIATSLGFWQAQFGISDFAVGSTGSVERQRLWRRDRRRPRRPAV